MRALVTGVTGQDGRYLAEHLLALGYEVFGLVRGQDNPKVHLLQKKIPEVQLVPGDLLDFASLAGVVRLVKPDEVYNLASISFVPLSWSQPELVGEVTGIGVLRLLEAIRHLEGVKFYQASSSEMFGRVRQSPQNEDTKFYPRSPYGAAKCYGHHITVNYRESYGLFACSGILFNHESPRRGPEFLSRKVSRAVARIKLGKQQILGLGNLDAKRDWGFAGDYVRAMHLMLQQDVPDDYVIGTGEAHSVKEFVQLAFNRAGLDWERYVVADPSLIRPAEVDVLVADASKASRELGWEPTVRFEELVAMMVDADLALEGMSAD